MNSNKQSSRRLPLMLLFGVVLLSSAGFCSAAKIDPRSASSSSASNVVSGEEEEIARRIVLHLHSRMKQYSTLAGRLRPLIQRFLIVSKDELFLVYKSISKVAHWEDILLLIAAGFFLVPSVTMIQNTMLTPHTDPSDADEDLDSLPQKRRPSILVRMAKYTQQISQIALAVYLVDILQMLVMGLGWWEETPAGTAPMPQSASRVFARVAYSLWMAHRLSQWKMHLLRRHVNLHPYDYGRCQLLQKWLTMIIYGCVVALLVHTILPNTWKQLLLHPILAMGGVGTVVVGLAVQGIVGDVFNGFLLASSDRIYEGDAVEFGNGVKGTIVKLGWLETIIRGSDDIMVSVPNTNLVKQHVSNLSRVRYCQVKQVLRLQYKEASKLPGLLKSIKDEIRLACPSVIADGSRPFRAHWTNFGDDHLEIVVDAHFEIKPTAPEYWDNRQRVLQAIHRAVRIHQVEFALPIKDMLSKTMPMGVPALR